MERVLILCLAIIAVLVLIDRFRRSRIESMRRSGILPMSGQETDADVERMVRMKRKIEAIKIYRLVHGVDLRTAKQEVDKLERMIKGM